MVESISTSSGQALNSYSPPKTDSEPKSEASKPKASAAPKFISPSGNIDAKSGTYTVQFRNTDTGEVKSEYPRKTATREYSKPVKQEQEQPNIQASDTAPVQPEGTGAGTNAKPVNVEA